MTTAAEPVMLEGVEVTGDLKGLLFEASVEQRFRNPTDSNVEVIYIFPLPWGAVLMGVEVQLGDKHLSGAVIEKKLAEARYEEALSEGNAAIMLNKRQDLSYSLNLGNLAAKEACVVPLRYCQTLQFEQHGLRLLLPTTIAPRFGDDVADGGLQPHEALTHSPLVEYPFNIELRLHGDLARARVASPSHPVGIAHATQDGASVLTVSLGRTASLDRDFVLVMDKLAHDSIAVLARDMVEADGVVALASFCPRIPAQGPAVTAVKVLVDCSGSMAGDSIDAAKRALQSIVFQLGKGDRFSLSRFGSTVAHRSRGLWSATETTRLAAQRWVGDLKADLGGTEMEHALSSTFDLAQTVSSDVLLVTDGEISAIDSTIEAAKASGHRVFVVGIGSSPAEGLLRRLAEATGGACDFVAPGEVVEPAVLRMFSRLRSPKLSGLKVVWPEEIAPVWQSSVPLSVFDGDTVNVYALFQGVPAGVVRLYGCTAIESVAVEIGVAQIGSTVDNGYTLSRIAASVRMTSKIIGALVGTQSVATKIAVDYQLVTDKTNFLLVHQRADNEKATDMPDLHKVEQMVPAGWGGTSSIMYSRSLSISETPAVYRTANRSVAASTDDFDVPVFLRKLIDHTDNMDERYWSQGEHYAGLTPLGLSQLLRSTNKLDWPRSYLELHQIGLGVWVIDWLEFGFTDDTAKAIPEEVVVETFLHVMSQQETLDALTRSLGLVQNIKFAALRLKSVFTGIAKTPRPGVNTQLAEKMLATLTGMTAHEWSDKIFQLDVSAVGGSDVPSLGEHY